MYETLTSVENTMDREHIKGTTEKAKGAIKETTGAPPQLSTTGGTSDGRFLATVCPQVVEFGPTNATIHKVNECVGVEAILAAAKMYALAAKAYLTAGT